jgi:hypothetical protein
MLLILLGILYFVAFFNLSNHKIQRSGAKKLLTCSSCTVYPSGNKYPEKVVG